MPLVQMRTCGYTGLHKKYTGKDAAEDHTSLVGPAGLGVRGRPNGRVLRKVFSADFRHIAQSAMFRALRDFPQNSVKKCTYCEKNYVLQYMRGKSPLCEETGAFSEFTCLLSTNRSKYYTVASH